MPDRRTVPVIGLIGGIGSGKSAVARSLQERLPIAIVDGDAAGHRVLTLPTVQTQIRERFGDSVFTAEGEIDRRALGAVVFGSPDRQALGDLETIVHPEIRKELQHLIESHRAAGEVQAIVLDAAVMLEAGWDDLCSAIVLVETPYEQRLQRVQSRGWDEAELRRREASQLSLKVKHTKADTTIDNSASLEEAARQLESIVEQLIGTGD